MILILIVLMILTSFHLILTQSHPILSQRGSGRMVATVRIFRRTIRVAGGKHTTVGGLGEVSTLPQ